MKTAVVIGHGLSPKGKGWGHAIDEQDSVIRMWNWHWQNPSDYGVNYHLGFFEVSPTEMARFYRHNVKEPSHGWLASKLKEYSGPMPEIPSTFNIAPERWEHEAVALGGAGDGGKRLRLTRGVRAAAWAIEAGWKRVILVGFDNLYASIGLPIEEGWPEECVASPSSFPFRNYTGGSTKYSSHDYAVEGPFLRKLAERHKVELANAQDIWK